MKKILISSILAAAMAFGMLGCRMDEDEHDIITIKGDTASMDYTNNSGDTYRGFNTLRTKHTDAVAVVTIDPASTEGAVFAFIFDLKQNKNVKNTAQETKTSYDFTAVAISRDGTDGLKAYVSRFEGVDKDNMDGGTNFKDIDKQPLTTTKSTVGGLEKEYLKGSGAGSGTAFAKLNDCTKNADGTLSIAIEVKALSDNKYSIKFYKTDAVAESAKDENGVKTGQIKQTGYDPISFTGNINGTEVKVDAETWNGTNNQTEMGFYAAVYNNSTLKGSIKLPYILHEDEVIEWDD